MCFLKTIVLTGLYRFIEKFGMVKAENLV